MANFEKRFETFWEEVLGIQQLLNKTNKTGFIITKHKDETVTQYILWRILNELKLLNNKKPDKLEEFKKMIGWK